MVIISFYDQGKQYLKGINLDMQLIKELKVYTFRKRWLRGLSSESGPDSCPLCFLTAVIMYQLRTLPLLSCLGCRAFSFAVDYTISNCEPK